MTLPSYFFTKVVLVVEVIVEFVIDSFDVLGECHDIGLLFEWSIAHRKLNCKEYAIYYSP